MSINGCTLLEVQHSCTEVQLSIWDPILAPSNPTNPFSNTTPAPSVFTEPVKPPKSPDAGAHPRPPPKKKNSGKKKLMGKNHLNLCLLQGSEETGNGPVAERIHATEQKWTETSREWTFHWTLRSPPPPHAVSRRPPPTPQPAAVPASSVRVERRRTKDPTRESLGQLARSSRVLR